MDSRREAFLGKFSYTFRMPLAGMQWFFAWMRMFQNDFSTEWMFELVDLEMTNSVSSVKAFHSAIPKIYKNVRLTDLNVTMFMLMVKVIGS